jgi:hypothetical protein
MKKHEKYGLYTLVIIISAFIIGGWNSCQAQDKQYPQKIILEMELEQVVKFKIPKNLETPINETDTIFTITKNYPNKDKKKKEKNNTKIRKEEHNEDDN